VAGLVFAQHFFVIRLNTGSMHNAIADLVQREIYSRTILTINYADNGFIRRGLGGTIVKLLSSDWKLSTLQFIAFSFAWLLIPCGLLFARLVGVVPKAVLVFMGVVLVFSPQTFAGASHDPARTDMLVQGFIAWAVLATLSQRRWAGVALILVGSLAHETAVIFGAPILLVCNFTDYRAGVIDRGTGLRLALGFGAALVALLLLQSLAAAPARTAAHMLAATPTGLEPTYRLWRDIAIYMTVSGADSLRTAICHNVEINSQHGLTAVFAIIVALAYPIILPLRTRPLSVFVTMFVPLVFMLIIANDTGRWLRFAVLNGWLLAMFLLIAGYRLVEFDRRALAIGGTMLAGLLVMGFTPYNYANAATHRITVKLGFPDPGSLDIWMDRCDPGWRRWIYGGTRQPAGKADGASVL